MTTENIPLNKLTAWEGNVRKTQDKIFIDELAASIKADGLQQNLIVFKNGKGYAVAAGGQRLAAMQKLAKAGDLKDTHPVPCLITTEENAHALSLVENTTRRNMHPADECDAFTNLVENGAAVVDVAARFGKTERYVEQRLRLARGVSKKVMKKYRDGGITLEQLQAFTVTDDFKAQDELLSKNLEYYDADEIRDELTETAVSGKDRRVKYVGLDVYEAAGGKVKRDLFGKEEDCYILDEPLLDKLASEKLAKSAKTAEKEGWKWVEVHPTGMPNRHKLREIYANKGKWSAEQKSYAGAVVSIDHSGKAEIERGVVRPADMPKPKPKKSKVKGASTEDETAANGQGDYSRKLRDDLTKRHGEALTAHFLGHTRKLLPYVARAAVNEVLGSYGSDPFDIGFEHHAYSPTEGTPAAGKIKEAEQSWGERIPDDEEKRMKWFFSQDEKTLVDLICFCAALSFKGKDDIPEVAQLAKQTGFDMAKYFEATADNYFLHVSKDQIADAIAEVKGTQPGPSIKKAAAAKMAEQAVAGKGWLPKPLRPAA